jgi:hypothetical protein
MRQKADLSAAASIQNRTERGTYVLDHLRTVANHSQADLRALLDKRDADYQPFYVSNAIRITAGEAVLQEVAAQPEVQKILPAHTYRVPDPIKGKVEPKVNTVEWNVADINAPQVWSQFGDRGEGIVVASIDTGTQFNHPALVRQYRGNLGGGNFDHNYNWWDPSQVCGPPGSAPCDNNSHGTHTMGTMVGDDGGANQVGVAPNAKWIEAKGCETNSCSDFAPPLLRAVHPRSHRPERGQPAPRPATERRQQLVGRRAERPVLPRRGRRLGRRRHLPGVLERQCGA